MRSAIRMLPSACNKGRSPRARMMLTARGSLKMSAISGAASAITIAMANARSRPIVHAVS